MILKTNQEFQVLRTMTRKKIEGKTNSWKNSKTVKCTKVIKSTFRVKKDFKS